MLALLEEAILDNFQFGLKENKDAGLISETAVLEINAAKKIRDLYLALFEIPETAKAKESEAHQEVARGWKSSGEIQEANSADEINQLNALRFEMKSGNSICRDQIVRKF